MDVEEAWSCWIKGDPGRNHERDDQLFEQISAKLVRLIGSYVDAMFGLSPEAKETATVDSVVEVWLWQRKRTRFSEAAFRAGVRTIVVRRVLSAWRDQQAQRDMRERLRDRLRPQMIVDPMERAEVRRLLEEGLSKLPGADAQLLRLVAGGRTHAEIARLTGTPAGSVSYRLGRTRGELLTALGSAGLAAIRAWADPRVGSYARPA